MTKRNRPPIRPIDRRVGPDQPDRIIKHQRIKTTAPKCPRKGKSPGNATCPIASATILPSASSKHRRQRSTWVNPRWINCKLANARQFARIGGIWHIRKLYLQLEHIAQRKPVKQGKSRHQTPRTPQAPPLQAGPTPMIPRALGQYDPYQQISSAPCAKSARKAEIVPTGLQWRHRVHRGAGGKIWSYHRAFLDEGMVRPMGKAHLAVVSSLIRRQSNDHTTFTPRAPFPAFQHVTGDASVENSTWAVALNVFAAMRRETPGVQSIKSTRPPWVDMHANHVWQNPRGPQKEHPRALPGFIPRSGIGPPIKSILINQKPGARARRSCVDL